MATVYAQPLRIYTEFSPPLAYHEADGKPAGLAVELVGELLARLGQSGSIELVPWVRGLQFVDEAPAVFLFPMARTPEREQAYQWIGPIYLSHFALYSLADSPLRISSLEDAGRAASIGVYRGDVREQILRNAGLTNLEPGLDELTIGRMLFSRRLDLIASSVGGMPALVDQLQRSMQEVQLQLIFYSTPLYIATSLQTSQLVVAHWQEILVAMRADGFIARLFASYGQEAALPF